MFFISCNKPKIVCSITEPLLDSTFDLGDVINLSVLAEADNTTISEVQVYLDDIGYKTLFFFPYNFQIYTDNLKEGTHTIRVVALAYGGLKAETTLSFNIVKYESPDFVSFSDGKIPKGWRNDEWEYGRWQIYSPGFDDDYAVRATGYGGLFAKKIVNANINRIEFYAKTNSEWAILTFYIDDIHQESFELNQSWERYSFAIPLGEHTFSWRVGGYSNYCSVLLDAIKFYKE